MGRFVPRSIAGAIARGPGTYAQLPVNHGHYGKVYCNPRGCSCVCPGLDSVTSYVIIYPLLNYLRVIAGLSLTQNRAIAGKTNYLII
jgi:hypothetical protein